MNNVIDLAAHKAKREEQKHRHPNPSERDPDWNRIIACPVCNNRAFTIYMSDDEGASVPGYDMICTACDCIVDLTVEPEEIKE